MNLTELENRLISSIDQRYQTHSAKSLADYIFSNYLFHTVEPSFASFAYEFRQEIFDYLSGENHLASLIEYCIRSTRSYTYQRNQFINFPESYDKLLYAEYRDFLLDIKTLLQEVDSSEAITETFSTVLRRHHERLRLILSSYCVSYNNHDLKENPLLATVPCEEYSARFQLQILNIDLSRLLEPVLDIGCGESGTLVNFLRNKGYVAFGLDRLAPSKPHFFQQNWFDFDFAGGFWGTIIAHHSWSTHFIHSHLHNPTRAGQYAGVCRKIISGLKPGGEFYYAPGLPFFEPQLEETKDTPISKTTIATNSALGIGEIFYSVKVKKKE